MNKEERAELINEEVKLDLDPILDLFGGADGAVGFTRLRHDFLPEVYSKADESEQAAYMRRLIKQMSMLCSKMMKP